MKNGNLEASDSTQKKRHAMTRQGSNNSAIVSTILELVNVTMRGKLMAAHEKSALKRNESKTNKRRRWREEGETACFYCCTSQKGQTNSVQLSISLKKHNCCLFVLFHVLASTMKLGWFWEILELCLVKVDFVQRFFVSSCDYMLFFWGWLVGLLVFRVSIYQYFQVGVPIKP